MFIIDNLLGFLQKSLKLDYISDLPNIVGSDIIIDTLASNKDNIARYSINDFSHAFSYIFNENLDFKTMNDVEKYIANLKNKSV